MITKGEGALGRIYERLRKRSYRALLEDGFTFYHQGYVEGAKDALQEVDKNLTHIYHEQKLKNSKTLVSGR